MNSTRRIKNGSALKLYDCCDILMTDMMDELGTRPGGAVRSGRNDTRFTSKRVAYLAQQYGLRPRYERLRERGMLTKAEAAAQLGIHEQTLVRWAQHGLVTRHAINAHDYLYEKSAPNAPVKHCSRWDRLVDRARTYHNAGESKPSHTSGRGAV